MMVVSTVLIPVFIFYIFRYKRIIASFQMETREERMYPYLSITIIYYLTYTLFTNTNIPAIYSYYLLIATVLSVVLLLINLRWKICIHTAAMGGMTAMFIGLYYQLGLNLLPIIILLILGSGFVGFARLKLNSHKPSEVYVGWLMGAIVFITMTLLL